MGTELNIDGNFVERYCECCAPRMVTMTTTTGHKWTLEEIKNEVLYRAEKVANAKWYNRGDEIRKLKHWVEKLRKAEEFLY